MIELKNVRVEFPSGQSKAPAVDGVSLAVREGEVLGIVGSSGAGKSTLVRTINLLQSLHEIDVNRGEDDKKSN